MADLDLVLRRKGRGGGVDLLALLAFLPSVISSFFTQNKGAGPPWAPPLYPPLYITEIPTDLFSLLVIVKLSLISLIEALPDVAI